MANYVSGYVLPVPTGRIAAYRKLARVAATVFKEHGALDYVECVSDDLTPPFGRSFTTAVRATSEESVVFAWSVETPATCPSIRNA